MHPHLEKAFVINFFHGVMVGLIFGIVISSMAWMVVREKREVQHTVNVNAIHVKQLPNHILKKCNECHAVHDWSCDYCHKKGR